MSASNKSDRTTVTGMEALKVVPDDFIVSDDEVVPCVKLAIESGAWPEPPPEYSESDPLQCQIPLEESPVPEGDDFWDCDDTDVIPETGTSWTELDTCGRVRRVVVQWIGKFVSIVLLLYIFICSLDFLSSAFRILGGKTAGGVFSNSEVLQNPVAGLMIGILATVLVQSSSTSTSIIVTMVGSGIMDVRPAIPMIMGANIGTSITNTFVSMAQSGNRREFRRAFAGATVHDMFNWLTVIVLLPLEVATGYLYHLTSVIVASGKLESVKGGKNEMLKALTKPFTSLVVQVDKKVISKIAEGHTEYLEKSLIKKYCTFTEEVILKNVTVEMKLNETVNGTTVDHMVMVTMETNVTENVGVDKCMSLLSQLDLGDTLSGIFLLIVSLLVLCVCLILMVKLLNTLLQGSIAKVIKRTLNADFPGCFGFLTGYVAMLVGALMTVLVQSSSVFTSALTPLVGIGLVKIERMYPLTLGSNIGTTGTGLLAAMASSGDKLPVALQIALCHLFFNISGILLFYPVPHLRKLPINLAKNLGTITSKYRWFAIVYLILMFFMLPAIVFLVSFAGPIVSICVGSVVGCIVVLVSLLKVLQSKCSDRLPKSLRNMKFLPKPLRSLEPYDIIVMMVVGALKRCCPCCIKCCTPKPQKESPIARELQTADCIIPLQESPTDTPLGTPSDSPTSSAASSVVMLNQSVV